MVLFPLSALILFLASRFPAAVAEEFFALGIYPVCSQLISRATGLLPFSLLEFGIIGLIILLIVFLIYFIRKVVKNKGKRAAIIGRFALNALCVAACVFFIFTVLCGVNYHRHPFSYYSGLEIQPSSTEELYGLCAELTAEANALRAGLTELDGNGAAAVFTGGYKEISDTARAAMQSLSAHYPVLEGYYPPVKPMYFSHFMSRLQLTGVYTPFTMEANVNVACTEYTIPATMCHELSHQRGFMREDEANFIAYLACANSGDARLRYSGTMLALVYSTNQLYAIAPELAISLQREYSEGVRRDLTVDREYFAQFDDTVFSKVSNTVNDTYLKANNQADGVQSYGRMADLLLALRRARLGQ